MTIDSVIETGRRLADVRDNHLDHGEWLPWLKREFKWSRQSADNFIHVYEAHAQGKLPTRWQLPLNAFYLLAAPSTPEEARTEIIERAEAGEKLSVADVREAIEEAKAEDEDEGATVTFAQPCTPRRKAVTLVKDEAEAEAEVPKLDVALRSRFYLAVSVLPKEDRITEVRHLMRTLGLSIRDFDDAPGEEAAS